MSETAFALVASGLKLDLVLFQVKTPNKKKNLK